MRLRRAGCCHYSGAMIKHSRVTLRPVTEADLPLLTRVYPICDPIGNKREPGGYPVYSRWHDPCGPGDSDRAAWQWRYFSPQAGTHSHVFALDKVYKTVMVPA